jgi:hypothetical protein
MTADPPPPGAPEQAGHPRPAPRGWASPAALLAGGLVTAYGLVGLVSHAVGTVPGAWVAWLLGALFAHDLVLAPAVLAAGRLSGRLPPAWKPSVRAALLVSGVVVLVTLPAFLGHGRRTQPGNASVLPNHYATSLALVLGLVWAVALLPAAARAWRRSSPGRP